MKYFSRFFACRSGGVVEKYAVAAAFLCFAAMGGAQMMQMAVKDGSLPRIAIIRGDSDLAKMAQNAPKAGARTGEPAPGVDYSTTATIRSVAGNVVLDPCTGKPK
ncbi:MAG: hypothetical protein KGL46_03650 [Hyphomicrobiales bacterium]|nr:hypothetical protein [Hyphomicrobiales bacterium]